MKASPVSDISSANGAGGAKAASAAELMKKLSSVLVNLQNPREKIWGILLSIASSGVTVIGIDLNSFDDWSRGVAREDDSIGLSTVFFPIHRVERVMRDETVGGIPSLAATFAERTGKDIWSHLGLGPGPDTGGAAREWMSLEEAARDHLHQVVKALAWDTAAAAKVLAISPEELDQKLKDYGLEPDSQK